MIYLDHAATSWPKPPPVLAAITDFLVHSGGSPGRSAHRLSLKAARSLYAARETLANFLNAPDPLRVLFTANATEALNLALYGLLRPGDRVVTTAMEHNAVMRPLRDLERQGVQLVVVPCGPDGSLDPEDMRRAARPGTRLLVANHASNVTGTLLPIAELGALAREIQTLLLVDAAQTAGALPLDMQALGIDLLAFTGHKALLGPPGTGGLVLGPRLDPAELQPRIRGGTGSRSEREEQPDDLPDKFESGTPNGPGIAGLLAGVQTVQQLGLENIRAHEIRLTEQLIQGLQAIPGVRLYGPQDPRKRTATVSFTVDKRRVSEVAWRLDEEFGVLCRVGLHCAPAAHRTLGTFPEGTIRFAAGFTTTADQIAAALQAVQEIAR